MKPDQFELFCNFTIRHGRFLKKSETSFTQKELDLGIKLAEKAVKAVQAGCKKMTPEEFRECAASPSKSKKIVAIIRSKVSSITPKQAALIVSNFDKFASAVNNFNAQGTPVAKAKKESAFGDRFYAPKEHKYR